MIELERDDEFVVVSDGVVSDGVPGDGFRRQPLRNAVEAWTRSPPVPATPAPTDLGSGKPFVRQATTGCGLSLLARGPKQAHRRSSVRPAALAAISGSTAYSPCRDVRWRSQARVRRKAQIRHRPRQ